jgi:hypothetical protein
VRAIKRIIIPVVVAMLLTLGIPLPVFADQPEVPGEMGKNVSDSAKDGGVADNVSELKDLAEYVGLKNLGQVIKWGLDWDCGIPPKHEP